GAALAQGGPFLPWQAKAPKAPNDPALARLIAELARMERLELLLVSLPSDVPTPGMELSSGFGHRYDPFNGQRAMHAGLDFRGAHGTPIQTAAAGRVSFVGVKSGYGNVVEVDHGHGLMTRYAHLSRFAVREGDHVSRGDRIALMGSTGRSTGPHLHFEVRVNGTAVNPRPFLETNRDVLEVKAEAGTRLGRRDTAG
ncbi:MAG: M23 family metallopeptidase, partial [Sandaracinobacteroides sp.]